MKFRRNCFSFLAATALLLGIAWLALGLAAVDDTETETEAEEAGRAIGTGIGVSIIICISVPVVLFLALMAWRNDVGLKTERRHQEQLDAMRGQRAL